MELHLFFPENDLALAIGHANYTPPTPAQRLRASGMTLPLWYGHPGDVVCCNGVNATWFDNVRELFGLRTDVFDHQYYDSMELSPWGWSLASCRLLQQQGVPESALPTKPKIEAMRQLSHRRSAIRLNQLIAPELDIAIAPPAIEVTSVEQLQALYDECNQLMAKLPWSSSGRGLCDSRLCSREDFLRLISGMLNNQGAVMIERAYEKVFDFALLYYCKDGHADFTAYSIFETEGLGKYAANIVAPNTYLEERITRYISVAQLSALSNSIAKALGVMTAGIYNGPVGVDMLIARKDNDYLLNATVEINFRWTMGLVAHRLSSQILARNSVGRLYTVAGNRGCECSPVIIDQKLASGSLNLTPPGQFFNWIVTIGEPEYTDL